ncbi:CLUMA_CG011404, isoform A [Clunio marinus]|uniref:CLUMA_CG011404, isoform A n=1 Tax=Clunio marinus TaxID=568069 RepID=A0A1J1ICV4_9DIPT|nr:CLUMA_CG011404, isoform A [Clunio marinus]
MILGFEEKEKVSKRKSATRKKNISQLVKNNDQIKLEAVLASVGLQYGVSVKDLSRQIAEDFMRSDLERRLCISFHFLSTYLGILSVKTQRGEIDK